MIVVFMCRFILYKKYGVTQNLHNSYNNALVLKIAIENTHNSNEYRKRDMSKEKRRFSNSEFPVSQSLPYYSNACKILVLIV